MNNYHQFFTKAVPELLNLFKVNTQGKWGSMNVEQMIDHLYAGTLLMLSKRESELVVPEEKLPRYKAFLMSDKGFPEGSSKPVLYLEYEKVKLEDFEMAKQKLAAAVLEFDKVTATDKDFWCFHPSFGKLNAEETRQLQFKHIRHHFQQFGLL